MWGTPDFFDKTCSDKSDISQDMIVGDDAIIATCGSIYTPPLHMHQIVVDWKWFPCKKAQKCIHIDNRCDLHPHPDCLYEKVRISLEKSFTKDLFKKIRTRTVLSY